MKQKRDGTNNNFGIRERKGRRRRKCPQKIQVVNLSFQRTVYQVLLVVWIIEKVSKRLEVCAFQHLDREVSMIEQYPRSNKQAVMKQGSQHCGKKVLMVQIELTAFKMGAHRSEETQCSSRCEIRLRKDCYRSSRNRKDNPANRILMKVA